MPISTYTKIGLISNALVMLGEPPATSITEQRDGVTVGAAMFESIYENELQSNRWRFAMKKGALSELVDVPANQWQRAFQLPSDMLLPVGIFPPEPYEIYGDRIYTNAVSVTLDYMFKPEVTNVPAYFALLIQYALAKDMAKPVTDNDSYAVKWERAYNQQKGKAQYADAQGRPAQALFDSPFTDVRG